MKPSVPFEQNCQDIHRIFSRLPVADPRVFGSVLHKTDLESPNLDLHVDPLPQTTLFGLGGVQGGREDLLGVPVDIRTSNGLPPKFRAAVVAKAQPA